MSQKIKPEERNASIQELLTSGVGLKNLYRFVVQNPHLDLYDASQIVISRPNASICFTFDEWNAMERRVTKGRKGILYYDSDGHRQYVFDMNDTHGERYKREVLPMKVLLKGLEVLCETGYKETSADFYKIEGGVLEYYKKNDMLTEDSVKNRLIVEGVAYMLYSKTSYPKMHNIALRGMPYSLKENGELFKTIYKESITLQQEIEDAYLRSKEEVPVINDVDDETITDEPIIVSEPKPEPKIKPKVPEPESKHVLHPIYKRYMEEQAKRPDAVVIQRLGDFYEIMGEKAIEISDRLDLTLTSRDFGLSERIPMIGFPYHVTDKYIEKILETNGVTGNFKPSTLYGLQLEGFKSANISPLSTLKNYERGINSSSLAASFPFVRTFVMDKGGIMLGENKTNHYPFIFNLWKRGNLYQNSNGMIIGKSGSGKSFFLKNLILNEWANGTRVITLDPEAEYLALTRNLSGNIIDVGNAKEGRINPFHIYKILTEEGTPADPVITFNTHLKMLESFFKIVLVGASTDVIELINNLVVETYERKGINETTDCTELKAEDFPLFTDLLETLRLKDKSEYDSLTLRDMRSAELYLQKFVHGRYSDIWNAPSTLETTANLIDFNFQSLFANKNNVVANAQMLLVFRFIEQEVINAREANRNGKNLRTMIVCDEAHLFIDAKFPIALDFFFSMSKRIRKYNGSFIPATQNIADWNANEELRGKTSAILKNSQYTFIFKLSAPDMKDVLDVYKAGDSFNEEEQRMIISAVTGQMFFIGSSELRTCVKITSGELAISLFDENKKRR